MQIVLHILAGISGALLLYVALFLHEGKDKRQQNRLEQIWQEIDTLQTRALSKELAFFRVAASSTSSALDSLFGKKLLSARSVTISVVFSLASTLVWLVASQDASVGDWTLMVSFCWLLLVLGSAPACAQSDSTTPSVQRPVVPKLYWFGIVVFAVVSQLFIVYRLWMGTFDNELSGFALPLAILSYNHQFILVLAFIAVELSILVALATDIFFLVLFRWVLLRAAGRSQFSVIALYFLLTFVVAAPLAGPAVLLAVPSLRVRFLQLHPAFLAVTYVVSTATYVDVACLLLFVCFMALLLLHRLFWPIGKQWFFYTAIRGGHTRKTKLLGAVGVMLLLYAAPSKQWAPGLFKPSQGAIDALEQKSALTPTAAYGGPDFQGVFFLPRQSMRGWVVGEEGTILHTEDGGRIWTTQASGTDRPLASVAFVSAQSGWAVGWYGPILYTSDGGHHWSTQVSEDRQALRSVAFASGQEGWAVGEGGTILHTEDGGQNWSAQRSGTREILFSVALASARSAWAVGSKGTILHTEDGGQNWSAQTSGTRKELFSVAFVTGQEGWTVGFGGTILHTGDGGKTWSAQASGTKQHIEAISFVDKQDGWVVGDKGTILHTEDGGQNWIAQASPGGTEEFLSAVMFVSKQEGWAVGMGKTILHTKDGGDTWRRLGNNR